MPNWCSNFVIIDFETKSDKQAFVENTIKDNNIWDLNSIIPLKNLEDSNNNERKSAWGTKWEPQILNSDELHNDSRTLELRFDTAWNPPFYVYNELVENKEKYNIEFFKAEAAEPGEAYGYFNDNGSKMEIQLDENNIDQFEDVNIYEGLKMFIDSDDSDDSDDLDFRP